MQRKLKQILHDYKKNVFRTAHHQQNVEAITRECVTICEEVLVQKYHYHFHKLPDANRAEIVNMIDSYVREAILPPVVQRLVERQVLVEKRVDALYHALEQTLEALSQDSGGQPLSSAR